MIDVFTDGSCHTQMLAGAWVALIDLEEGRKVLQGIARPTTHHRMELMAVLQALEFLLECRPGAAARIITDSQYVNDLVRREDKLTASGFTTKAGRKIVNEDLLLQFYRLLKLVPVSFVKVKAHQHDADVPPGNHEADLLSRSLVRQAVRDLI